MTDVITLVARATAIVCGAILTGLAIRRVIEDHSSARAFAFMARHLDRSLVPRLERTDVALDIILAVTVGALVTTVAVAGADPAVSLAASVVAG